MSVTSEGGHPQMTSQAKAFDYDYANDEEDGGDNEGPSMAMAPAWQAYRNARDAFNDPTCSEAGDKAEYDAREAELSRAHGDILNASVTSEKDIIAAVARAKELLDDGQDEMCSEVLDEVLFYHYRLPDKVA